MNFHKILVRSVPKDVNLLIDVLQELAILSISNSVIRLSDAMLNLSIRSSADAENDQEESKEGQIIKYPYVGRISMGKTFGLTQICGTIIVNKGMIDYWKHNDDNTKNHALDLRHLNHDDIDTLVIPKSIVENTVVVSLNHNSDSKHLTPKLNIIKKRFPNLDQINVSSLIYKREELDEALKHSSSKKIGFQNQTCMDYDYEISQGKSKFLYRVSGSDNVLVILADNVKIKCYKSNIFFTDNGMMGVTGISQILISQAERSDTIQVNQSGFPNFISRVEDDSFDPDELMLVLETKYSQKHTVKLDVNSDFKKSLST